MPGGDLRRQLSLLPGTSFAQTGRIRPRGRRESPRDRRPGGITGLVLVFLLPDLLKHSGRFSPVAGGGMHVTDAERGRPALWRARLVDLTDITTCPFIWPPKFSSKHEEEKRPFFLCLIHVSFSHAMSFPVRLPRGWPRRVLS